MSFVDVNFEIKHAAFFLPVTHVFRPQTKLSEGNVFNVSVNLFIGGGGL